MRMDLAIHSDLKSSIFSSGRILKLDVKIQLDEVWTIHSTVLDALEFIWLSVMVNWCF